MCVVKPLEYRQFWDPRLEGGIPKFWTRILKSGSVEHVAKFR